jgi:hypothetical protein
MRNQPRPGFPSLLSALLAAGFLLVHCSDRKSPTDGDKDPGDSTNTDGATETTSLFGRIQDDTGGGLAGVVVSVPTQAGKADTTDANGFFSILRAKVPKGRAYVTATKAGYYRGARAETPSEDGTTRILLRMMKKTLHTVNGAKGGKVSVAGGGTLDFPADAFVTEGGSPFSGSVSVAADYINPDSGDFWDRFPGDNLGRGSDGKAASLVSAGVLRVELATSGGSALKLADGKPATLIFPKPAAVDAPDAMPLWWFDDSAGIWREEGSAALKDGAYTGEVRHFSDWNLDFKGESGTIRVTVRCQALPLGGVVLRVGQKKGITDRFGVLRFINAPAVGPATRIEVLAGDNGGRFFADKAAEVAVERNDTVATVITLDSPCPPELFGTLVGCDEKPVEGYVTVKWQGGLDLDYSQAGDWKTFPPMGRPLTLNASDIAGNALVPPRSVPALGDGQQLDLGAIRICGSLTSDFHDFRHDSITSYNDFELSPDGKRLSGFGWSRLMAVWDVPNRKLLKTITLPTAPGIGHGNFSDDNARFALGYSPATTGYVFDVAAGSIVSTLNGVTWLHLMPDGKTVLATTTAKPATFTLINAEDATEIKSLNVTDFQAPKEFQGIHPIAYDRAEDAVVYLTNRQDKAVFRVWSLKDDALLREIATEIPAPRSVFGFLDLDFIFSRNGDRLGLGPDRETLDVYNVLTGEKMVSFSPQDLGADASPDSPVYGTLTADDAFVTEHIGGAVSFMQINLKDKSLVKLLPVPQGGRQEARVAFPQASKDADFIAAENGDSLRVWSLK